jgi:hypothetical protein
MTDNQALRAAIEEGDLDTVCAFINTQEDFDRVVELTNDLIGPGNKLHMLLCNELPEFAAIEDDDDDEE